LPTISIVNINASMATAMANSKSEIKWYKNNLKTLKISGLVTQSPLHQIKMCSLPSSPSWP
jgi:hypothetical protein